MSFITKPPDMTSNSPPASTSSTPSIPASRGTQTPLSLDLSSLPPLTTPSPPSNTLLITNLNSPSTFHATTLQRLRDLLSQPVPLNSFSPLKSLHRIIVSYPTTQAAIDMRQVLDGVPIGSEDAVRIYFGEHTPVAGVDAAEDQSLHPPSLGKLLFISPPPSPPCGWEIREEDPPNKDVHAEDLQRALAGLNGVDAACEPQTPISDEEREELERQGGWGKRRGRKGTGGTVVYHPRVHGDREDLPAVTVEDTTEEGDEEGVESGEGAPKVLTKTARPPVELMGDG